VSGRPPCLLTIHAHPDDEASKGPGTVALYGSRGVRTVLVCCTGGEEGDLHNPALAEPGGPLHGLDGDALAAGIAALRPAELDASAAAIGFDEVIMLGYRDSGMAGCEANEHPDCFAAADLDEATERLVSILRSECPDVVLTYGDDQSGYPHPDHLRVHEVTVAAVAAAADAAWRPHLGPPHEVAKVYYSTWSRRRLIALHEALLAKHGESPFDERWWDRPDADHRITTRIDIRDFMHVRTAALRAHATQIDPTSPFWFGLDDDEMAQVFPYEDWICAMTADGALPESDSENDLFDGIVGIGVDDAGRYVRLGSAVTS